MTDPLEPMERDSLTIWGDSISAQMRDEHEPMVLYIRDDAPRSSENYHPAILTQNDVDKLRELLNEAERRKNAET